MTNHNYIDNVHLEGRWTQHAFVYDSYFTTKVKSACQGAIIDNIRYAPICLLEEKSYNKKSYTEEYA